jgi:nucleotidyltransferase substrate binding protein (TIGR01987 family)
MKIDTSVLEKALASLQEVLALEKTAIIRDSAIQRFEYTYELAVKLLKRKLEDIAESAIEVEHMGYRDMIRFAAEKGFISDPVEWFDFREKRNITSHTYDEKKAEEVYAVLHEFASEVQLLIKKINNGYTCL